ncbi:MAG: PAS domain-containing protein [Pseudomonadota bacterium]
MNERRELPPAAAAPSAALLAAWLDQSHDLLALTDATGGLRWCNAAFTAATGLQPGASFLALAADHTAARSTLAAALEHGRDGTFELTLRGPGGDALWVDARVTTLGAERLWTLHDTTERHELATRAQHLSELLDMAQEFGRLGVWEREIPSGKGRWDRHVFGFWGMSPSDGTPDFALAASRVHPDDRIDGRYEQSTRQAGRYNARYRVVQPDGKVRWLHSQWEVKNSPQGTPDRTIGIMMDDTDVYELARSLDHASAQLRLAAELADIVIWRHDLKTDQLHYNEHGFKVLRIPPREGGISLQEGRSYTHPDDVHKLAGSAVHSLHTDGPVDVETRHRWPDGSWRHMLVRRVVERDADNQPVAFVGISLDVTDQVERTRRAEQMTRRLEAAARAAHVGIWMTRIGTAHTEWNEQMYELFDRIDAGQPPTLSEWLRACVHPDDVERVGSEAHRYVAEARGVLEIEFRVVRRDDSIRWVVLRGDMDRSEPQLPRIFGIAMDVTDRHAAQAALHAVSERAALIAGHAGIGTWETEGPNGPGRWDEQMFRLRGLEPGPVAPDRAARLALVHPDDRATNLDSPGGADIGSAPTAYEFRILMPDGSHRWLASRSAALCDAHGNVVRRVGVNWDITEARNAELARQQAVLAERESEAKSQFLSRMSHELRTPLNAVLGFTQLLQLEARQTRNSGQSSRLDHIRAAGEHLLRLIDNALDLSSLQSGTLALDLQAVPLACAIAQALPLVTDLAATHEVALHSAPPVATVQADPARLRQILLNLLSNAIKFNRPGGQVIVDGEIDGDMVRLNVRDTGRGLRSDQLEHLFEPFNRLGVENEGIEGSGIGLSIVKALVEGMHGQIAVSSVPGRGSVFEVSLPLANPHRDAAAPPHAPEAPAPGAPRARSGQLLYIEDNAVNVLLVEELVTSLSGLRLAAEGTGAAGVARARELLPDLILIDMQLPDFDGFEVLRQLRQHPETAGISCIALSANAMPEDIERGLAAGFDDYWTKPIKFKPFLDALDRIFPPRDDATTR